MLHRHRTGMARLARKAAVQTTGTVDRRDHPEREIFLLQARSLLNVQLQIGHDIADVARGTLDLTGIQPHVAHRLGNRDAVAVRMCRPAVRPGAGNAATAQQRDAKARALFIPEADDFNGQRQSTLAIVQPLDGFNGAQHA